jgi:hypothetical protein
MPQAMNSEMEKILGKCLKDCADCHNTCLETAKHCMQMGGKHAEPSHITLLNDCAEICLTSANSMLRGSVFSRRVCEVCAEECDLCAQSCESIDPDDAQMKSFAGICRACAGSCRQMAGM